MTKILAVDPGTTEMGLYDGSHYTTIAANRKKPRYERLGFMAEKLGSWFAEFGPYDFVVYEEQFVRGGPATKALYGVVGVIEALSTMSGAGVMPIPQGTLRRWAEKEGPDGLKGKALYEQIAVNKDEYLAAGPGVTEHVFDAACIYYFIEAEGSIQ